jgi:hypothetical protein
MKTLRRGIERPWPGAVPVAGLVLALAAAGCAPRSPPEPGLPDWSGTWQLMGGTIFDRATAEGGSDPTEIGVRQRPPYNSEWEGMYLENLALRDEFRLPDLQSECGLPVGYPRMLNIPGLYEFVVRPEQVWIIAETGPYLLRVYTDGRPQLAPEELWPTYTGDSVGHWEGDTLVFTTVGLKGSEGTRGILDRTGVLISDEAQITTRIRKTDETTIEVELTIEDSRALRSPWVVTKRFERQTADIRLYDYACAENNRNPIDYATGRTLQLGPDGRPLNLER